MYCIPSEVLPTGDFNASQAAGDGGEHLYIEQAKTLVENVLHEMAESDFGGIARPVEHRFSGKQSADGDAIDAAGELFALPAFETMGVALLVQA